MNYVEARRSFILSGKLKILSKIVIASIIVHIFHYVYKLLRHFININVKKVTFQKTLLN